MKRAAHTREDYRIATLNCGGEDFAVACMRSNLRYGKNQKREDVKSHHYIISFDPRDGTDNGLTVDRAQELGENFAASISPDTKPLSAPTRTDTTTAAISMCISSLTVCGLRKFPCCPTWTDRQTQSRVQAPLHRRSYGIFQSRSHGDVPPGKLYQIDLLHGSKNRITEREYWAQRKGQQAGQSATPPLPPGAAAKPTKFETDKEKLRQDYPSRPVLCSSYDEFPAFLLGRA